MNTFVDYARSSRENTQCNTEKNSWNKKKFMLQRDEYEENVLRLGFEP